MSSGVIRRIDDLGRIVIPKEIRRTLKIDEGDPLEIGMEDGRIIMEKYKPFEKDWLKAKQIVAASCGCNFVIADRWGEIKCAEGLKKATISIEQIGKAFGEPNQVLDDDGEIAAVVAFSKDIHPMTAKSTVRVLKAFLLD